MSEDKLIEELHNGRFVTWIQALEWCVRFADALAAKDTALAEMKRELERATTPVANLIPLEHDGSPVE